MSANKNIVDTFDLYESGRELLGASVKGNADKVKEICERFKDHDASMRELFRMHSQGWTPLINAAAHNHPKVLAVLLQYGADATVATGYGLTAFLMACARGSNDAVEELLKHSDKVDVNQSQGRSGNTAVLMAAESGNLEVLKTLFACERVDKMAKNSRGENAVYLAAYNDRTETLAYLVDQGVSKDEPESKGLTPLHAAAKKNNDDAVKTLLSKGANVAAKDSEGNTPLHSAASENAIAAMAALVEAGADFEEKNENGFTVVHLAVDCYKYDSLTWLGEHGASLFTRNNDGKTPLQMCADSKNMSEHLQEIIDKAGGWEDVPDDGLDKKSHEELVTQLRATIADLDDTKKQLREFKEEHADMKKKMSKLGLDSALFGVKSLQKEIQRLFDVLNPPKEEEQEEEQLSW